jgi:AcrR family transcriptional regulator
MGTRDAILTAALKILEEGGEDQFSTRTVCARAKVTAPTLYHHFGSADGLLGAAIVRAFEQFLESKRNAVASGVPTIAVRQGWDDYVRFAAARPRLYAAMFARLLRGARIDLAEQAYQELLDNIKAVQAEGGLAVELEDAADLLWSSANAASLLYATTATRQSHKPTDGVVERIRECAMTSILKPDR